MKKTFLVNLILALVILGLAFSFSLSYLGRLLYPFYFKEEITNTANQFNFDPCFIAALILVESKFDPRAVSKKGACGLMQVMPSTAVWIAEKKGIEPPEPDSLFKSEINIGFGVWYLDNLCQEFDGLIPVLAAYNAGRGNVKLWLDERVWDGSMGEIDKIPFGETKIYVKKVWQTYAKYKKLYDDKDNLRFMKIIK